MLNCPVLNCPSCQIVLHSANNGNSNLQHPHFPDILKRTKLNVVGAEKVICRGAEKVRK